MTYILQHYDILTTYSSEMEVLSRLQNFSQQVPVK